MGSSSSLVERPSSIEVVDSVAVRNIAVEQAGGALMPYAVTDAGRSAVTATRPRPKARAGEVLLFI
jgi:hypothetical protein